jgi:hypothetical protein
MRGDVGELARAVAGGGKNRAVAHDDGADRHLAARAGRLRLAKRRIHEAARVHIRSISRLAAGTLIRDRS